MHLPVLRPMLNDPELVLRQRISFDLGVGKHVPPGMALDCDPHELHSFYQAAAPDVLHRTGITNDIQVTDPSTAKLGHAGGTYSRYERIARVGFDGNIKRSNERLRHELGHAFDHERGVKDFNAVYAIATIIAGSKTLSRLTLISAGLDVFLPVDDRIRGYMAMATEALGGLIIASHMINRYSPREIRARSTARKFSEFSPLKLVPIAPLKEPLADSN